MEQDKTEQAIAEHLFRYYGLQGSLERLAGQNLNYQVTAPDGERYVFKINLEDDPGGTSDMEFALLEHARNAGFSCNLPGIIKTYNKKKETGIKIPVYGLCRSRLMTLIDGVVLEKISNISTELLKNCGKTLAAFDQALVGFDHPAAHLAGAWELPQAGQHRGKLNSINDPVLRERVAWAFDRWQEVQASLIGLPQQVIHGDANKENILVKGDRVSGLVDFGDACFSPRICELAICLAYLMMDQDDPLAAAECVIAGYDEVIELHDREREVLFPLVCGRLAVSICMASSRLESEPENTNLFVSLEPAMSLLSKLEEIGETGLS